MKESDLETLPLCAVRPGVVGCHQRMDNYQLFACSQQTREVALRWAAETRALIKSMGLFPTKLQKGDA